MAERRRLRHVVLIAVLACGCIGSHRSDDPGPGSATDDGHTDEQTTSLWPADPVDIALIANDNILAASDGSSTAALLDITGFGVEAIHSSGDLVALKAGDDVILLDLESGDVTRRFCPYCIGVAVVGEQVVSTDADFTMLVFDRSLRLVAARTIEHVSEARLPSTEEFEQTPRVVGTLDGRVAMIYLATNALVRGGPEIVSVYELDGTLVQSWTVDGLIFDVEPDADGSRFLLGVGGSGGACNTLSSPAVLAADAEEAVPLLSDDDGHRDFRDLSSTDLWWNGNEPLALGRYSGMADTADCAVEPVLWRFPAGEEPLSEEIDSVQEYRLLGRGCDRAFLVRSEDVVRLEMVTDGHRAAIDDYNTIVWTAPRPEPCSQLPGIEER